VRESNFGQVYQIIWKLAANLFTYVSLEGFYKGNVTCSDGKKALIFTSNVTRTAKVKRTLCRWHI